MAFINIAEWTAVNTTDWLKGLDDCILPYVQFFLNNNINGCRLLLLSTDDLNHLNVRKVGHQELILDAVDLLKHLHYNFGSETLQSLALRLGCKARSLYNQLKHSQLVANNNNNNNEDSGLDQCSSPDDSCADHSFKVSTETLSAVSDILAAVKAFISWIDRVRVSAIHILVRKTILKLSIELASTAQRDQFVDKPNEVIQNSCITLAELSDRIVQELNDSLAIQPAFLDIVTVKKKPDEELGMHIHSSYSGIHMVGGIKFQSPAYRCGRIEEGDEIVQVSYQTVVGWQLKKLVSSMKEHPTEVVLTVKKRPRHSNLIGQVIVFKPYKLPNRKAGRQSSRLKNAATTTTGSDGDDDAFLPASGQTCQSKPVPVYHLSPRKPKLPVRRRATISGSSPTVGTPPIRIEDVVANMSQSASKREPKDSPKEYNRSVSYDSPTITARQAVSKLAVPLTVPLNGSPSLPYAKVHPFPNEEPIPSPDRFAEPKKASEKSQKEEQLRSDTNSLDRQRLNFLKDLASGHSHKITDSYGSPKVPEQSDTRTSAETPKLQPPRPLPRKSIARRDNALPAIVSNVAEIYGLLNKAPETRIPSIPSTPPTRPAVPKPNVKLNGQPRTEAKQDVPKKVDDTYEYVFRPTMAMIKTGIVNPLYERVPNNTWSGDNRHNSTGKSRMPLPNEMRSDLRIQIHDNMGSPEEARLEPSDNRLTSVLSILDREYTRLYGAKKPNERLSPRAKSPVPFFIPKSASSAEIETIYTSKPRTTSSSSISHSSLEDSLPRLTRTRPSTPLTPSTYICSPDPVEETHKSSPFRLFSSPKLLKKLSTPKYHKERHLEKKDSISSCNTNPSPLPSPAPVTKTSRLFLGSPRLTRALFGGSGQRDKKSLPQQQSVPSANRSPPPIIRSAKQTNLSPIHCDQLSSQMNRSSSDSSVQSSTASSSLSAPPKSYHIIEKMLTARPELTIQLPIVTDTSDVPLTPGTPRKPTMGVAMINKKRRPSNVSASDRSDIESALNQYYGSSGSTGQHTSLQSSPYNTEDTDDEWASIVRTIDAAGRQLEADRGVAERRQQTRALLANSGRNARSKILLSPRLTRARPKEESGYGAKW